MRSRIFGFSLLEISIVLLIISTIIGASITIFTNSIAQKQEEVTRERMRVIQKTLLDYRRAFHAIPCPAMLDQAIDSEIFGLGTVSSSANCPDDGGTGYAPNYSDGDVYVGTVPVRTLKLPDEFMFDGWGRRFTYAVDDDVTQLNAFSGIAVDAAAGDITIQDNTGASITTAAIYAIVSHGENGHGAFPRVGGSRVRLDSTNANEQNNCSCDDSANFTAFNRTFVQGPYDEDPLNVDNNFDDIVLYGTRASMRALNE